MDAALLRATTVAVTVAVLAGPSVATTDGGGARWFPDRPVAWLEHDDADVAAAPAVNHLQELDKALLVRDSIANEIDRVLALERRRPAQDVNAMDEVPCSTWFCARNHLLSMTPAEVAAGPPATPPTPPLRIVKGKDDGATLGFPVVDAAGRKFMLKFDGDPHLGHGTTGELVGVRLFHAAGYHTVGTFLLSLRRDDLTVDPHATFHLYGVQRRTLSRARVEAVLARAAKNPDGTFRAVAVSWVPGRVLGAFDMIGRRTDDPNDRIPHEDRRSLRADWMMYAWLSTYDASALNTLESYVEENGRRFVRHYHFDFGCSFGSGNTHLQSLHQDAEHTVEVGRTLAAAASLGFYRRPFQSERRRWEELTRRYPSIGYYPAEGFDPETHRTNRKVPAHMRLTARDAYWGAKVVTAFSDAQIDAVVETAALPSDAASYLAQALKVRRDIIGRRYLRTVAAVEDPETTEAGGRVCFRDLAIVRGAATPAETRYLYEIRDGRGNRLAEGEQLATGARTCLSLPADEAGTGYRIINVTTVHGEARPTKASRVHLRWRDAAGRFVVVGLERDD